MRSYSVDAVGTAAHGTANDATDATEYAGTAATACGSVGVVCVVPRGEGDSGNEYGKIWGHHYDLIGSTGVQMS